jgi:hypothetical protein
MGFPVNITKRRPALYSGSMVPRIDTNPLHSRKINHNTVVTERPPGDVVATAAYRDQEFTFACEIHGSNDIGYTRTSRDDAGALINAGIPDLPRSFITSIT